MKFLFKAVAAYMIGALLGGLAAVASITYSIHPALAFAGAIIATVIIDYSLVRE